jgi:hypothetical protein
MAFIQVHEPPGLLRISGCHVIVNSKTWRSFRYMNHPAFSGYPDAMSCKLQEDMAFIQVHEPPGLLRISGYHVM